MKKPVFLICILVSTLCITTLYSQQVNLKTLITNLKNTRDDLHTFRGTLRVNSSMGDQTIEVYEKDINKLYTVTKDSYGNNMIAIYNGKTSYTYMPDMNLVTKQELETPTHQYPGMKSFMDNIIQSLNNTSIEKEMNHVRNDLYKIVISSQNSTGITWINKNNWLVYKKEAHRNIQGENIKVIYQWKNTIINPDIPDSRFEFIIPRGVKVVEK